MGNLVPSKLNGYIIQLSNYLNWKPAGAIDSFKFWKVLITSRWYIDNSSGKDLFLGKLLVVCCVGNKDRLLKRFWGQTVGTEFIDHCSIFHHAVNIFVQNVIHTALSVSLLANLFYWKNKSTAL